MRIAAVLAFTLVARVAHAEGEAERLYQQGQAAYDAKQYDQAIAAWDQSYALSKLPALVFNLAQAHRLAGHCTQAVEAYRRFLALDPASTERPDAEQFLKELEPCAAVPQPRVELLKRTEDRGRGKRHAGMIMGAVGLVTFATGLYFGSRASSLGNDIEAACANGCEWSADLADKEASGKTAQTLQYVFYAVGAAELAGAVSLYLLGNRQRRIVIETPAGGGVALGLAGRF